MNDLKTKIILPQVYLKCNATLGSQENIPPRDLTILPQSILRTFLHPVHYPVCWKAQIGLQLTL